MRDKRPIPLLDHPIEEPTAFPPETLIAAVRKQRGIGDAPAPPVCVLDFDGDVTDWLVESGAARPVPEWACFHTTMYGIEVEGVRCGLIARTIGGPFAVLVAEQLAVSGAGVVIGLTSAGRVWPELPIPALVVATSAVRDEGTSYHYLPPGETAKAPAGPAQRLVEELEGAGPPVFSGSVWTTDAPYRETRSELERHAAAGVLAVEMQAASLFAFSAARGLPTGVVAHVTNAVDLAEEGFDNAAQADGPELVRRLCRAGLRFLGEAG